MNRMRSLSAALTASITGLAGLALLAPAAPATALVPDGHHAIPSHARTAHRAAPHLHAVLLRAGEIVESLRTQNRGELPT